LILLRIAIGWHFLNEGVEKIQMSRMGGGKPFSAEGYLRNATGPLARYFRGMVPDANGLAKLDPARLKAGWADDIRKIGEFYGFDAKQKETADELLHKAEADADIIFLDKTFLDDRTKYYHDLGEVQRVEWSTDTISYDRLRAAERRKEIDADRRKLVGDLDAIGTSLKGSVDKLATEEQVKASGGRFPGYVWGKTLNVGSSTYDLPFSIPQWDSLQWINFSTQYGLVAIGACLILGLFTRPAALAGAVFLAQIYLSMPPWPGLPRAPGPEHFFIVDMHLIEMLACLFLATTRSGRWIGVDALLFGWIGRRRARAQDETTTEPDPRPGRRSRAAASQPKTS
jgi:uncharacterized membrane protein YphA (DoxX/SURF4 family)